MHQELGEMRQLVNQEQHEPGTEYQALRLPDEALRSLDGMLESVEERIDRGEGIPRRGNNGWFCRYLLRHDTYPFSMNPGYGRLVGLCSGRCLLASSSLAIGT